MGSLDQLDVETRAAIRDVLSRRARRLFEAPDASADPNWDQLEQVMDVPASEFEEYVSGPDWEPTTWGKRVDGALGWFLKRFPSN